MLKSSSVDSNGISAQLTSIGLGPVSHLTWYIATITAVEDPLSLYENRSFMKSLTH